MSSQAPQLPPVPGSFRAFMDKLVELEKTVHPDLPVYRWQPYSLTPPAIFNWLTDSPFIQRDLSRWRDNTIVLARIGVMYTEQPALMDRVEEYTDAFRQCVDSALAIDQTLGGTAFEVHRINMRFTALRIGDSNLFGPEFVIQAQLDRHLPSHE